MSKEELIHKVYLATFSKPRFVSEIGKIIYGVEEKTYPKLMGKFGAIEKCLDLGWIKKVNLSDTGEPGFKKRKYYQAQVSPLIKELKSRISLNDFEEYTLRNLMKSDTFRNIFGSLSIDYNENVNANQIFLMLDYLGLVYMKTIFPSELGRFLESNIQTRNQYDEFIHETKDLLNSDEIDIKKKLMDINKSNLFNPLIELLKDKKHYQDFKKDVVYFIIAPKSLYEKLQGITWLGELDSSFFAPLYEYINGFKESTNIPS